MNKKLFIMLCLLTISFAKAQLTSVALVGSGTTTGWPTGAAGEVDGTVMNSVDTVHWTLNNVTLLNGAVKFRGNNSWTLPYNWGGPSFPTGTGVLDGNGFTSVAGIYNVTFNSTTGDYNFILQVNTFPVISLIGTSSPGVAWTTDTDMSTIDGINYSINRVMLIAGAIKFRQDHAWTPTTNWGGTSFPSGTGIVDGAAITVPTDGKYNVTFNRNTLAYSFSLPTVAVVGAGAGGWPTGAVGEVDAHPMTTTDGINYAITNLVLTADNAKFRANNSWTINWGATSFPNGTAILDSPDSFLCVAGTYSATFNYDTRAYSFTNLLENTEFNSFNLKIYPNPTHNEWNFTNFNDTIENIQIADVLGKTIINVNPKSKNITIATYQLNSGVYFARITTSNSVNTLKLIKN
jgi:hypothetical protein